MENFLELAEEHRDKFWRREESLKIETVHDAEKFIESVGFCATLTDVRTDLPSIYIAVCGRREAHTPKNVQKDYETSLAWTLKDDILRRGKFYYGKVGKLRALCIAPRLVPHFNAVFGVETSIEEAKLSINARKVLEILKKEWESATSELRADCGFADKKDLTKALDELQSKMKVVPLEVLYEPKFTYIWTLAEARFPNELTQKLERETALKEIVRAYLQSSAYFLTKNLAKTLGLTPLEINLAGLLLCAEGFAGMIENAGFKLNDF